MYRPLVLYAISILLGSVTSYIFLEKIYIGIIINVILIIIFYKNLEKEDFIIAMIFVFIGFMSHYNYFNFELGEQIQGRIIECNKYKIVATVKNRKIVLEGEGLSSFKIGDIFEVKGNFEFDVDYKNGVLGVFNIDNMNSNSDILSKVYNIKNLCYQEIEKYDEELANFVMAISLGDKSFLDYEKKGVMNTLGIIHIITVSGFHIALIYTFIEKVLNYKVAIVTTFIYITIIGYTPSTVRAFIMIFILVMSKKVYRNYDSLSSLSLAFIILVSMKPYYILNPAFNLSFLSVLGIITMKDKFDKVLDFLPTLIKDSVAITLSASMFTTLYMAYSFKKINLNGIVANFLLMPFYSFLIIASNLLLIVIYIPKFNKVFIYLLKGLLLCTNTFENFIVSNFNSVYTISYIGALTITSMYISYIFYKRNYKNTIFIPIIMTIFTLFNMYSYYPNISYIKTKKGTTININYKMNNIILSNNKVKISKIREDIKVDRIYDEIENEKNIKLNNKYNIMVKNNGKYLDLIVDDNIIITKNRGYNLENNKAYKQVKIVEDDKNVGIGFTYDKYKLVNKNVFQVQI